MIIKNALVYTEDHKFEKKDVRIEDERIAEIAENGQITATDENVIDGKACMRYRDLWIFIFMGR